MCLQVDHRWTTQKSSHTTSSRFDTHSLNDYANESYRVRWILEGKAIYKHLHRKDLVIQSSGNDLKALTIRTASQHGVHFRRRQLCVERRD